MSAGFIKTADYSFRTVRVNRRAETPVRGKPEPVPDQRSPRRADYAPSIFRPLRNTGSGVSTRVIHGSDELLKKGTVPRIRFDLWLAIT